MKKLSLIIASVLGVFAVALAPALPAYAVTCTDAASCVTSGVNNAGGTTAPKADAGTIIKTIVDILLFVIGAVSVIMIVIGGLRYVISGGDAKQVQAAKNTILYALVGVIIAILAYAVVNFVSNTFITNGSGTGITTTSDTSSSGSSVK